MTSSPLKAVLIGAGQRGALDYALFALLHPDALKFLAVAEPNEKRRTTFAQKHDIQPEFQYESWEQLLDQPAIADVALVATQDWQHTAPAVKAMQCGYHVLLEKPMANKADECRLLLQVSQETKRQLHICHVLRYTGHFQKMRELVQSGVLGQIVQVDHRENVSFWHMAHSYVRGNWANQDKSSPMILAKCCHDLDILPWVLGSKPEQLVSFGDLNHFKPENAPQGAPQRCLDGCPAAETCPYYAPYIYETMAPFWNSMADSTRGFTSWATHAYTENPNMIKALSLVVPQLRQISTYDRWPLSVLADDPSPQNIARALQDGPYGRCVYHCDNNVVDNQVVLMKFGDGASVSLTMHGHAHQEHRTTKIEGSHGRLMADFGLGGSRIVIDEHRTDWHMEYDTSADVVSGHGGGDMRLMQYFVDSVNHGDLETVLQTTREALTSHLLAFAAEVSRLGGIVLHKGAWQ